MAAAPGLRPVPHLTGLGISEIAQNTDRAAALTAPGRAFGLCGRGRLSVAYAEADLTAAQAPLAAALPGGI